MSNQVRLREKMFSSRPFPLNCGSCGSLSYAPGSAGSIVFVVNTVLFTAAGFAGFYWRSWGPVIVAGVLAVLLWLYRLHIQPLFSLTPQQASKARVAHGLELVLLVLALPLQ